jgi:hypothetical protein
MDAMSEGACRDWAEHLGPYLLGQLNEDDHLWVAEHVARCPACAAEVAELRPVADLMPRLDTRNLTEEAEQPSALLGARILREVTRHRRRRAAARLGGLAAACAVLVAGIALAAGLLDRDDSDVRRPLVAVATTGPSGDADLAERSWGTSVTLDLDGLTPGTAYVAWLERPDGSRVPAGSFRAEGSTVRLTLAAALPLDQGSAVGVSTIDGQDILRAALT